MSKHTPGPWEVGKDMVDGAWDVFGPDDSEYAEYGDLVAVAGYMTKANARLIAAAPEMLTTLRDLSSQIGNGLGPKLESNIAQNKLMEEAIAKNGSYNMFRDGSANPNYLISLEDAAKWCKAMARQIDEVIALAEGE